MSQPDLHTAQAVSEYMIRITQEAYAARDFARFASAFHLPQTITTASSKIAITNREDLRRVFDKMCDHFEASGITSLERSVVAADYHGPDRVESTHVSRVVRDGRDLVTPYPVFSVMERIDGVWRLTGSDYALEDTCPQALAMLSAQTNDPIAETLYQEHLDDVSTALVTADFVRFSKRTQLPQWVTTEADSFKISELAAQRAMFDTFATHFADRGLTAYVGIVIGARFITENEIVGSHITHQIRRNARIVPPYPSRLRLMRGSDGQWRETHAASAILNTFENYGLRTRVAEQPRLPDLDLDPERIYA